MDASFQERAEQLANEFAGEATMAEEPNDLMRLMMKSGLERMLNRAIRIEAGLHGHPRGVEAVDDADSPLETGTQPLRHPLRGPNARTTLTNSEIAG